MDEKEDTNHPLVDIVKTLRSIPDRDKPCDREVAMDGTEILLYRQAKDIQNWEIMKARRRKQSKKSKKSPKGRKKL